MKIRYSMTILATLAAIGATAWIREAKQQQQEALSSLRREHDQALADLRRKIATLQPDRQQARDDIRWTPSGTEQLDTPSARLVPKVAETIHPPAGVQKVAQRTPEEQRAEVHLQYEAAYVEDGSDPQWANASQQKVRDKLPSLLPNGSTIRSFECHATMCRLETAHKGSENYWQFIRTAFLDPEGRLWNAPTYSTPLNDDPEDGMMVTFIAREGQVLPQFAE
jgi:hypothetical protein